MPPVVSVDLSGMTVVVVGANTGLGYDATKHFASMKPARLIMACRSKQRGEAAVQKLASETGYNAELWLVDLASFESVIAFADKFDADGGRLDILVMNAGLIKPKYEATVDGWETCLQINNIASPLLSLRMIPHMNRTAQKFSTTPRLVTVASDVHYWAATGEEITKAPALLEKLSDPGYCTTDVMGARYWLCKLINVFFTRALQDRLSEASSPIISVCLTPNLCGTGLMGPLSAESDDNAFVRFMVKLMAGLFIKVLAFTSEEGSRQLVYAAVGGRENEDALRGAYISFSAVTEPSDFVISKEGAKMQNQYWSELVTVLSKVDEKVLPIVNEYLKN